MANTPKRKPATKRQTSQQQMRPPARDRGDPTEEEIRRRAHELYEQRGREPGHEHEDWAQAERELRGEP
jgi:hypothetical protein